VESSSSAVARRGLFPVRESFASCRGVGVVGSEDALAVGQDLFFDGDGDG
jgi:hypothetical protein